MNILCIHQNFPGQYRHLARALLARGDRVVALGGPTAQASEGIPLHRYDARPAGGVPACHPWAADLQTKCFRAQAVAETVERLLKSGAMPTPDLVLGHPGWGELLAIKDVLPEVPVLHYLELVYLLEGGDVGFDPELDLGNWRDQSRLRLRRAPQLLALWDLDWAISPTHWQASTAPAVFADRISVIHDGIPTESIRPQPGARLQLHKAGLSFQAGDEVVTFVARQLEPYRGFHRFMRMLPLLQALRPRAHVILVGGDEVAYGQPPPGGGTWREALLRELGDRLDPSRIHFVGRIPHPLLHDLFRVSACHVYLTVPFVLSWSLLEAMACGAVVVGSATAPVQEVIESGVNGLLVDYFDAGALAATIAAVLADPQGHRPLGLAARATVVERYDLQRVCLPQQLKLVDAVANRRRP